MSVAKTWSAFQLLHLSKPAGERIVYKATKGRPISSVLEVQLSGWQRTERLIAWLRSQGNTGPLRYVAVDLFDISDRAESIELKAFHQRLAAQGLKPLPIPGTPEQGLPRVIHTLGAIDLVLVDLPPEQQADPVIASLLARVVHQDSVLLVQDGPQSFQSIDARSLQSPASTQRVA